MTVSYTHLPAAIEQLQINGEKQQVEVFSMGTSHSPVDIAKAAMEHAEKNGNNVVILDTAGRLHIDEGMMEELQKIKQAVTVHQTLLVVDAMTGQDAVSYTHLSDGNYAKGGRGTADEPGVLLSGSR